MGLSSEFPSSFLKEGFPDSPSHGWQETTVRNEGEGRAAGCPPESLHQDDYAQPKYNGAGDCGILTPTEDQLFPERLRAQSQLKHTSEKVMF